MPITFKRKLITLLFVIPVFAIIAVLFWTPAIGHETGIAYAEEIVEQDTGDSVTEEEEPDQDMEEPAASAVEEPDRQIEVLGMSIEEPVRGTDDPIPENEESGTDIDEPDEPDNPDEPEEPEEPEVPEDFTGIWEDGKYYTDGVLATDGYVKIDSILYKISSDGTPNKYTGTYKTDGRYYQNGILKQGWRKAGNYYYYYVSGKRVKGWRTISSKRYYFNQYYRRVSSKLRKIGKKWYYFNGRGVLRKGKVVTTQVIYYTSEKSGALYGLRLRAPVICQRPELPTGCEIVSWTMMANHAGVKISKTKAANIMPRSGDPNRGFVGSPYRSSGGALVVYPGGLMKMTRKYLGSSVNMTGCSMTRVRNKLRSGHVVMAWVRWLDGFGSHTVALTGYKNKRVYYHDPWTGTARSMSEGSFLRLWNAHSRRALSY